MIKVKRALISVSDKTGIVEFSRELSGLGVEILSTGGTAKSLRQAGIPVIEVADYTGFPEILDGRVKTLHPKIHSGILALRELPDHMTQLKELGMGLIDMVVVNLYPFEKVIARKKVDFEEAIENIDIGGPTMLRAAAKNFRNAAVICNPQRYETIVHELKSNSGMLPDSILSILAEETFGHTAQYDERIFNFLKSRRSQETFQDIPREVSLKLAKERDLRYGENPHQKAAFYGYENQKPCGLTQMKQLNGKELSFNNLLDLSAALEVVKGFKEPAAVIIKHNNPTGVAEAETLVQAYRFAHSVDRLSAFGGIIGLNKKVDEETAVAIGESGFMECVIAPGYEKAALKILSQKKNLRVIQLNFRDLDRGDYQLKQVDGGFLLQEHDRKMVVEKNLTFPAKKKPTAAQIDSALFGWKVVRYIRSNAVILVKGKHVVGIGCGQTSRVGSAKLAIEKAGKDAKGSIMVSDAFLPHVDNVQVAAAAGIKVIIQTGGSVSDEAVIREADKQGIAMIMTGARHFKH